MKIGERELQREHPPYIVAEVSCNHLGKLDNAMALIEHAKKAGADAVKFQAYTPDTITLNCNKPDFIIQDGLWKGRTLYDLYKKAHTPFAWFPKLFGHAEMVGITAFASVFDQTSIEMLEKLNCPAYKIASFEIADIPLIKSAAFTGKPLIISTGLASGTDIMAAHEATGSSNNVAFLHCTSEYPGTTEFSDLSRMSRIDQLLHFKCPIGLSDHTPSESIIPIAATAMRTALIEKHLKLPGDKTSEDAKFSLEPDGFAVMVKAVKITHAALQPRHHLANPSHQLRRSLYAVANIKEGETFTIENIRSIRPGYGMHPKELPGLIGKLAEKDYRKGDRLS